MNKFTHFIKENFQYLVLIFLIINFFHSCDRDVDKLSKKITKLQIQIDSLQNNSISKIDLQIEGLRSEKRMIQSVDRKLFDLEREKEIDREINKLIDGKSN